MTIDTGKIHGRRKLRFESLDELQRDAEYVATHPGKTLGNWNIAQILDHLSKSIRIGFEGPQVRAPWFVRWIIGPIVRRRMLSKGMPAGFSLPKEMSHFMPGDDANVPTSLENLRTWLARLKIETPPGKHPAFGALSHADWVRLHLRHGELHLSFVVPE